MLIEIVHATPAQFMKLRKLLKKHVIAYQYDPGRSTYIISLSLDLDILVSLIENGQLSQPENSHE